MGFGVQDVYRAIPWENGWRAGLGRGKSWTVMPAKHSLGQHHREVWNEYCQSECPRTGWQGQTFPPLSLSKKSRTSWFEVEADSEVADSWCLSTLSIAQQQVLPWMGIRIAYFLRPLYWGENQQCSNTYQLLIIQNSDVQSYLNMLRKRIGSHLLVENSRKSELKCLCPRQLYMCSKSSYHWEKFALPKREGGQAVAKWIMCDWKGLIQNGSREKLGRGEARARGGVNLSPGLSQKSIWPHNSVPYYLGCLLNSQIHLPTSFHSIRISGIRPRNQHV